MNLTLDRIAQHLVADGRGILAADESTTTCGTRLAAVGLANTEDNRRAWRDLLFTAPKLEKYISGVILYDETIRQTGLNGKPFVEMLQARGIMPGIKVDKGTTAVPGSPHEFITEGLDGLPTRVKEYAKMGATFAKWRGVIKIAADLPTVTCIQQNANALARYAAICQENGLVPIVEPEVLMDGTHSIDHSFTVTEMVLHEVFNALYRHGVELEAMLLKPSMVIAGDRAKKQAIPEEVADWTLACLQRTVPVAVPGIVFLSGGQSDKDATLHLDLMNKAYEGTPPWALTYSYGRALQNAAMSVWRGSPKNVKAAQIALIKRCELNTLAAQGKYKPKFEK